MAPGPLKYDVTDRYRVQGFLLRIRQAIADMGHMENMSTTVVLPELTELTTTPAPLQVSRHDLEEHAARATMELRAALRRRGVPDADYLVETRQHPQGAGWIVTVTSDDAIAVVYATCLDALLRRMP